MKKILVSIVAALMAVPSFAQVSSGGFSLDKASMYYGIRLGATSASISGDADLGSKIGMTLGGVLGLRLSESTPIFLESGLYYTQRGGKKKPVTLTLNNFEIPVLVKYGIPAGDNIAVVPFVGPYFAYAFNKSYKVKGEGAEVKTDADNFKRANMGFKFGCGFEFNQLYLEAGYQLGVSNILDDEDHSAHSNALFVNFGVNF